MTTDVHKIKNSIHDHMDVLRNTYNVEHIGVFGSMARGDNKEESDIDLLVKFSQPVGFFTFIKLEDYLAAILGKKVDLVTEKALKSAIKDDILQEVVYV